MSNEAISIAAPVEETEPDPLLSVTEIRTDRVCNSIIRRSPSGQFIIELVPWGGAVGRHMIYRVYKIRRKRTVSRSEASTSLVVAHLARRGVQGR